MIDRDKGFGLQLANTQNVIKRLHQTITENKEKSTTGSTFLLLMIF